MKVFAVVNVPMNPYGEEMGYGSTEGIFTTRASANRYIKELTECHRFNFTDKKDGHLKVRMPKWKVRIMKVED